MCQIGFDEKLLRSIMRTTSKVLLDVHTREPLTKMVSASDQCMAMLRASRHKSLSDENTLSGQTGFTSSKTKA